MKRVEELAAFVRRASYDSISAQARQQLKPVSWMPWLAPSVLSTASHPFPPEQIEDFGGTKRCT